MRNTRGMARPPARIADETLDLVQDLASRVLDLRAAEAAWAVDHAAHLGAVRALCAMLLAGDVSPSAIANYLRSQGVQLGGESTIRAWAADADREPEAGTPTWWEVIDHRDPAELQALMQRTLGMAVDVEQAPCIVVPVTPAQVDALHAALPAAIIGPADEVAG